MILSYQLAELFGSEVKLSEISENNVEFKCRYQLGSMHKPNLIEVETALNRFPKRDSIDICCFVGDSDGFYLTDKKQESIEQFLTELEYTLPVDEDGDEDEDDFRLEIKIKKSTETGEVSVYSLSHLVQFWSESGVVKAFGKIQALENEVRQLRVFGLSTSFKTNCLLFTPFNDTTVYSEDADRNKIHLKRDMVGHFANASKYEFVPDDFIFDSPPKDENLSVLFEN